MTLQYTSQFNAYIPEATGQVIAFIRDPKTYRYNEYTQLVKAPTEVGVYMKLEVDNFQRFVTNDEDAWPDGARAPENKWNQVKHDWVEFQCIRRMDATTIGWLVQQQAAYKVLLANTKGIQNQHMAKRTQRLITMAENTANWGNNTDTANNLNGGAGFWDKATNDPGDVHFLAIKKTLDQVAQIVQLNTNGVVNFNDPDSPLILVLAPGAARKMSQTSEIHSYLQGSAGDAYRRLTGTEAEMIENYGLPKYLYGWKIVVEDAVRVGERPKASGVEASTTGSPAARRFIKSEDSAIVCVRPGKLDGTYGTTNYSTMQLFYHGSEIELETLPDNRNRLDELRVISSVTERLAAPASGYLIQDIIS